MTYITGNCEANWAWLWAKRHIPSPIAWSDSLFNICIQMNFINTKYSKNNNKILMSLLFSKRKIMNRRGKLQWLKVIGRRYQSLIELRTERESRERDACILVAMEVVVLFVWKDEENARVKKEKRGLRRRRRTPRVWWEKGVG